MTRWLTSRWRVEEGAAVPLGRPGAIVLAVAILASLAVHTAYASHNSVHLLASLPGSDFEIDVDANLKVDDPAPSIDWADAGVTEDRKNDAPTGKTDDSYGGGAKEDDACPATTTGSIPNNKSDLLTFGSYVEEGDAPGEAGFLHLFWTRVQEPSGTTLMDFELNQSTVDCGNGVNPLRTAGDLLIEYRIEQGGAAATVKAREWDGSAWGPAQDLTAIGAATGTINSSAIAASASDGLGALSPRTFGEMSLDLNFIFDENTCTSFGSAFLKSRASDAFNSALKDFIKPISAGISNCGKVIVRKVTEPTSDPAEVDFGFTKAFPTDPSTAATFSLGHGESKTFANVLTGTGYTVDESGLPVGWDFGSVDCSASTGVTPSITGSQVTFDIDSPSDILDCTYTNRARGTIVVEKVTNDGTGSFGFTSDSLTPSPFTLTTTAAGEAGKDSKTFANLAAGTYDVAETVPAGWNVASATCDDGSDPDEIMLSAGETVTCTFVNERETGAILITKTRKHAADGPGDHPHEGVTFTVTGGQLPPAGVTVVTDEDGEACVDGLVLSSFFSEGYTVTESVPSGYVADDDEQAVTVTTESTCGDGNEATVDFHNTPLTTITVSVDSQVEGGTKSTMVCRDSAMNEIANGATGAGGDGSVSKTNLPPGTYECTIVVDP